LDTVCCGPRTVEEPPAFPESMAPTPPKQARQGLYLASRGFDVRQEGHMGRPQHRVRNSCSELELPLADGADGLLPSLRAC
jgi:hypothetical protein